MYNKREITEKEIEFAKTAIDQGMSDFITNDLKCILARQGYALNILINDPCSAVRCEVAMQGYGFDVLINDNSNDVREIVVEYCCRYYGSNQDNNTSDDKSFLKVILSKAGYGVKNEFINRGYFFDILINDADPRIRYNIAEKGYGLDILINDPDSDVRKIVNMQTLNTLAAKFFTVSYNNDIEGNWKYIEDLAIGGNGVVWIKIKELVNSEYKEDILMKASIRIKKKLIREGLCLEELINDTDYRVRCAIAKTGYGIDQLIKDNSPNVRDAAIKIKMKNIEKAVLENDDLKAAKDIIKQGYIEELLRYTSLPFKRKLIKHKICLNEIANSRDGIAKKALAQAGYKLDILVDDKYYDVRISVAIKKYGLEKLVKDDNWLVRRAVARVGDHDCLKILINDPISDVRYVVASRGYGAEKLIWDKNEEVRKAARKHYRKRLSASSYIHHEYKYHDPIDSMGGPKYLSDYNYDGYPEEYYNYN